MISCISLVAFKNSKRAKFLLSLSLSLSCFLNSIIGYNMSSKYRFPVHSVKSCPIDAKTWDEAAMRRNCSLDLDPKVTRNRYQCVPDAEKNSLLEFCYDEPRPLVEKGISN